MPTLYRKKIYVSNASYHIFNRGINKNRIFRQKSDYTMYLRFLKEYLSPKQEIIREASLKRFGTKNYLAQLHYLKNLKNYYGKVKLLAYCLMPNHIHLLVQQTQERDIQYFMKSLHVRYAMYINKKYGRLGPLFQDRYKAKVITDKRYLLIVSRYIHTNPIALGQSVTKYPWSSLGYYSNKKVPIWLDTAEIENEFKKSGLKARFKSYLKFIREDI